jgi:hypothetical protein
VHPTVIINILMASPQHLLDLPYAINHFIHMYGMRQGCIQLWVCWSQFVPLHPGWYLQILTEQMKKISLEASPGQSHATHCFLHSGEIASPFRRFGTQVNRSISS